MQADIKMDIKEIGLGGWADWIHFSVGISSVFL
jgi:hypothetical protein